MIYVAWFICEHIVPLKKEISDIVIHVFGTSDSCTIGAISQIAAYESCIASPMLETECVFV